MKKGWEDGSDEKRQEIACEVVKRRGSEEGEKSVRTSERVDFSKDARTSSFSTLSHPNSSLAYSCLLNVFNPPLSPFNTISLCDPSFLDIFTPRKRPSLNRPHITSLPTASARLHHHHHLLRHHLRENTHTCPPQCQCHPAPSARVLILSHIHKALAAHELALPRISSRTADGELRRIVCYVTVTNLKRTVDSPGARRITARWANAAVGVPLTSPLALHQESCRR